MFEVPTTLDALHDIIGQYASTGADVTLIIQRIHKVNSVRLDHRNMEKMQNFYDLLLRRFIAVGDAIYKSGDGGNELCRYKQLDALTVTLYEMAQESPDCTASVWSRRLGIFHKAHAKRLRDAEYNLNTIDDEASDDEYTTWPSTGVILLLRAIGHIFPVTDKKHPIVTPLIIFLSQILTSTPILSKYDLVSGLMMCGILIEYTKDAKRIVPEVHAFLACVIRMFAGRSKDRLDMKYYSLPPFGVAAKDEEFIHLRNELSRTQIKDRIPSLSLEKTNVTVASILYTAMHFVECLAQNLHPVLNGSDKEAFADITESILCLDPKLKSSPLPKVLQVKTGTTVSFLSTLCKFDQPRVPIQRRLGESTKGVAIKSLAPRIENPERYSLSKDKGKTAAQSAADRTRREYKREHKAVARELRLDNTFIENERRVEEKQKTDTARAKRNKAYAWLEGEQAAMNQQIRQGGGLLQGGGTGAAKIKARTGKMGIKKGGKF
jgi:nucleolar protein 14